jgi:transcriptional regulator with XRE-family HTH domain
MAKRGPGHFVGEANVADHVRLEREMRGWSTAELARQVTAAGCPLSQSAVWRIESGDPPRKISVDELVAFAKVFDKPIDQLLEPVSKGAGEPLIRLFLNEWIEATRASMNADSAVFSAEQTVLSAYWENPEALQRFEEDLRETLKGRGATWLEAILLEKFRSGMADAKRKGRPQFGPGPREIIVGYREMGKSDDEIRDLAERWGVASQVEEALASGKVRMFVEGELYSVPTADLAMEDGVIVWPGGPRPEFRVMKD